MTSQTSADASVSQAPEVLATTVDVSTPKVQDTATEDDNDADSALHNANFLSFEDWKKQKLGDTGQSPEALSKAKGAIEQGGERHRPGAALDTLGEDSEIDLDFAGFGTSGQGDNRRQPSTSNQESNSTNGEENVVASGPSGARSKDAGRTCKERFNYASFDCAANVLKTNPKCKSSSSVLVENKDSYMLNECSVDNKFFIVELCEYIQIDTVVLANFEFFSSMFRTFRVSVSDRYPVKIDKWQELGTYEARNTREIQAFLIENPLIWAKYIRIEFLTHYGNEFYCPLSLLRVHGTTMMEDYRHQEELARGEVDVAEENSEEVGHDVIAVPAVSGHIGAPEAVIAPVNTGYDANPSQSSIYDIDKQSVSDSEPEIQLETGSSTATAPSSHHVVDTSSPSSQGSAGSSLAPSATTPTTTITSNIENVPGSPATASPATFSSPYSDSSVDSTPTMGTSRSEPATASVSGSGSSNHSQSHVTPKSGDSACNASITTNATTTPPANASSIPLQDANANATVNASVSTNLSSTSTQRSNVAQTPSNIASPPATQESFFKTLSKRLSLLEANATLSLQYIESQSMLLREAFAAVEKRQLQKTTNFLAALNETVLKELALARVDYDQLWQSTVLELAGQREDGRRERELLNDRVRLLAEELVGQKRLMAVQATLLLVVLGLVVFTKVAPGQSGEVATGVGDIRILQSMQALMQRGRSSKRPILKRPTSAGNNENANQDPGTTRRWGWESPLTSPNATRPGTSHGMDETQEDAWDELLAFVDENVRPRQGVRSTSYLKQKPLPPAPRPQFARTNSELEESEEGNDSSNIATPLLQQHFDGGADDFEEPQDPGRLGIAGRVSSQRRPSIIRAARSAPTTPQVEHSPILTDGSSRTTEDGSDTSGASVGEESVGLGIEID